MAINKVGKGTFCGDCPLQTHCYLMDGFPPCVVVAQNSTSTNNESLAIALWNKMLEKYEFGIDMDMIPTFFEEALKEWRSAKADVS